MSDKTYTQIYGENVTEKNADKVEEKLMEIIDDCVDKGYDAKQASIIVEVCDPRLFDGYDIRKNKFLTELSENEKYLKFKNVSGALHLYSTVSDIWDVLEVIQSN